MRRIFSLILIFCIAVIGVIGFLIVFKHKTESHTDESEEDFKRGAHHGRLLEHENFQVEVTIFEPEGVPPKFRTYFYQNGASIDPKEVTYEMELQRINRVEKIPFKQEGDFLESTVEASEPHSFKVDITATYDDEPHHWVYESYESRVELTPETIAANQIKIEKAESRNLEIKLDALGKIVPNEELTAYITPRFPGVVKSVSKKLGDYVKKGDILAVIESNESLRNYEIKSEINGMIIKKNINLGMYLNGQENIFVISDVNSVWADFNIYCKNLSCVKVGDPIQINSLDGNLKQQSTISYISCVSDEDTQSVTVRSVISNENGLWKPGLFISGEITVENIPMAVTVKDGALQKFREGNVVFISVGNLFEVVPVEVGRTNKDWVEIKSGLSAGDHYVSENSYILKADLEKSGAVHEH